MSDQIQMQKYGLYVPTPTTLPVIHKSSIGSLLTGIHNLALLVLQKIKVFVALVNSLHALMTKTLRDDFTSVFYHKAALLDWYRSLNSKSTFRSLMIFRRFIVKEKRW